MVFCNEFIKGNIIYDTKSHNPYFSRWFSAIYNVKECRYVPVDVTILILVDGFLQYRWLPSNDEILYGHNPYFSRWFSAI